MKEINPNRIKRAEIIAGVPSFNEADTISGVALAIDKGLQKYFKGKSAVIINADNNSPDNTAKSFLGTKTITPKIYISTSPGVSGKGNNLRNIFLKAGDMGARACMILDSDIRNITPKWVKCLIGPVLRGYDYVSPVFFRDEDDASITNHICYPLVYGLLGYNIRQPIAGEIGFSKSLARYWLSQKWFPSARKFGIDIFMTLSAIKGGFRFCKVDLGSKIHKQSLPKLDFMFLEVVGTLFKLLSENQGLWRKTIKLQDIPIVCKAKATDYPDFEIDYQEIIERSYSEFLEQSRFIKNSLSKETWERVEKIFQEKPLRGIDGGLWSRIVYDMLCAYRCQPSAAARTGIIRALRVLYFARMATFDKECSGRSKKQIERIIVKQAEAFLQNRTRLLSLLNQGHDYKK